MEKYIPCKWEAKKKKTGVAILISDKIYLKVKKITRDNEGHYIVIKGSIQEEDITTLNIYVLNMLLLLLLSRFSRVRLCATPSTAAHQAPPSLGFSRQEHWSGLPFPSPMHESEKWKWSRSAVSDSSQPHGLQPTRLLHPWDFPGKSAGVECHCFLRWTQHRSTSIHKTNTNRHKKRNWQ